MGDFPLQGAIGALIAIGGIIFALMEWSRQRGRIGKPISIGAGSLLIGAWVMKPDLAETGRDRAGELLDWVVNFRG